MLTNTFTIPKRITKGEDLVVVPKKEYEQFLRYRLNNKEETVLTLSQNRRLKKARGNLKKGNTLTLHELKRKLDIRN